ncbi:kinase-like protein [Russula earlei]|uniref:Kinase-like protein n=1 Tax=Russula earlei TaxID=71964 RepID=A0ACC0UBH1_9AGAM|nr:kinase-like protein [Russula earlei]
MSTDIVLPDIVNVDFHRPIAISAVSSNASITPQTLFHSSRTTGAPYHRRDDSSVYLDDIPHVGRPTRCYVRIFALSLAQLTRSAPQPKCLSRYHAYTIILLFRLYNSTGFSQQLLDILRILRVPSWSQAANHPVPCIQKVSGSFTNAVFFVSSPSTSSRTLLLRIYGPSTDSLISRTRELQLLHVLSSRYKLGPRIYGTFTNGRLEEYFDSVTLTAVDIREPRISAYIGARMAELHGVDVTAIDGQSHGSNIKIGVCKNVHSWLPHARAVLALPAIAPAIRKELDLDRFHSKWESYMKWLKNQHIDSHPVLCHNDAQYGNILRLNRVEEGTPEHHQIIVVDFEYASPNPAAFDIANHFHEWTANYHGPTPHVLDASRYPNRAERRTFLTAYLRNRTISTSTSTPTPAPAFSDSDPSPVVRERELVALENAVCAWSPSTHAMWSVWALVQARENVLAHVARSEFDYVNYACRRMAAFYRELASLGV